MTFLPGTRVEARGTEWEVVHVEAAGEQTRVRLRGIVEGLRGRELDLLHPFERIEPITKDFDHARAGRLEIWRLYHQAFLLDQDLGASAFMATQPGRLDIAPYQLVPVMKALRMSRPRLLLADGVGLGKTIQAGLVLTELIARRRAHRVLVVSPAGPLLQQWNLEMRSRFGLRFDVVKDQGSLQELRRQIELGANPFDHVSYCLTSIDYAKQERVLELLERTTWDVVIIDESHHCVSMGAEGDREDSQRRRLAEVLARQCDGLLLLTATPHDGYDPHFASLIELLDPSLVDGRGSLRGERYRNYVVRRLKKHVKTPDGKLAFPERNVQPVPVAVGNRTAYEALVMGIHEMVIPRLRAALRHRRYGEVLAFIALLKRTVSTVAACKSTLQHVADRYSGLVRSGDEQKDARTERLRTLRDYRRRLERFGSLTWEEEADQAIMEAEDIAAELRAEDTEGLQASIREEEAALRRERSSLSRTRSIAEDLAALLDLARNAQGQDAKLDQLLAELRRIRDKEPAANVLVYTEYTDSQDAAVEHLRAAVTRGDLQGVVSAISGPDSDADRTKITERFGAMDGQILVSTDATAEGLNLHARCHHLIHLELPYNPNRLEQRNGRIDRYGQQFQPQVRYLYLQGTFEQRLLARLLQKVENQRKRLTFVPDTLGNVLMSDSAEKSLIQGLAADDLPLLQHAGLAARPEPVEGEAWKELMADVDRVLDGFEKNARSHAWLGDAGLNAEDRLLKEAAGACHAGEQQSAVSLLEFVCAALRVDTGRAVVQSGDVYTLPLSDAWTTGLKDVPGYDPVRGVIRVTANRDKGQDDEGPIGCLGRAHPMVRRALDRVRNLQFGGGPGLDRRVSAAKWDGHEPAVLWTYLGTVRNHYGRAFERVFAVLSRRGAPPEPIAEPTRWEGWASTPVVTADLWGSTFASWAPPLEDAARAVASAGFSTVARQFRVEQAAELASEQRELDAWLQSRADELCGRAAPVQTSLLEPRPLVPPTWRQSTAARERLAGFAVDAEMPIKDRREAEGVLKLYRDRQSDLQRRKAEVEDVIVPLGVLMLVPGGA